ncbi:MAG TPA: aspartate aminotransferase family protein [Solirubrobacteraceae bacterium]|jgi:4-aminobutyrate aminotransferase-like enzyme|nr:aspartate aminotransferase family protein [Solirubrobacteraceae bacterium]
MRRTGGAARRAIDAIAAHTGGGPRLIAQSADVVIERGSGSYLYNDSGDRLLDAVSGYGVASLGHSHPRWVEAVVSQARRLAHTTLHTAELAGYLTALADVLPPRIDRIALATTGAEAIEMAMWLAQTERRRPGILTFADGFHGKTAAVRYTRDPSSNDARSLAPHWLRTAPFPACRDHDAVDYGSCHEPVEEAIATIATREDLDDVAAVLVEPVLGTAGNIPPRRGFLAGLRELCRERDWLLIYDESITGFGRTGELFAFGTFGVEPDIVVLAKGLGGGFPLSAVCAPGDIWQGSALSTPSSTSSSYGANPLACAAGKVTLEIVTDRGFMDQVRATAGQAAKRLRELAEASPRVVNPRGIGLMLGFDLVDPDSGELASDVECEAVFRACRDAGVLVAATVPRVRLSPPLTLTAAEADRLFDVLLDVLA